MSSPPFPPDSGRTLTRAPVAAPGERGLSEPPREVELKLELAEEDLPRVLRHPALRRLAVGRSSTRPVRSLYYDTPDLGLFRRGLTLRVRQVGRQTVQTVKTLGAATDGGASGGGLFERVEVESSLSGSEPDIARIEHPGVRQWVYAATLGRGQGLAPVVETETRRTRRSLRTEAAEAELALDVGEVRTRTGSLPVCELELELVHGEPGFLYDVALALHESFALRPSVLGKAERGFAAITGERAQPQRASRPALARDVTLEGAMVAILRSAFAQIVANREPARDGHDPEGVHQMRVGVRRLRSALSVFKRVLPAGQVAPIQSELRWLASELGKVRDIDVFCEESIEPLFRLRPDDRALKRLRDEARRLRDERQAALREVLDSRRTTGIVLMLGRWLASADWRNQPLSEEGARLFAPAQEFATSVLQRRHRKALKLGHDLGSRTVEERHALRLHLKKLRYASEFLGSLYPRKRGRQYASRLSELQDDLGHLNDVETAERLLALVLEHLGSDRAPEHERAAGYVCGWLGARAERRLAKLERRWRGFVQAEPFWS